MTMNQAYVSAMLCVVSVAAPSPLKNPDLRPRRLRSGVTPPEVRTHNP